MECKITYLPLIVLLLHIYLVDLSVSLCNFVICVILDATPETRIETPRDPFVSALLTYTSQSVVTVQAYFSFSMYLFVLIFVSCTNMTSNLDSCKVASLCHNDSFIPLMFTDINEKDHRVLGIVGMACRGRSSWWLRGGWCDCSDIAD